MPPRRAAKRPSAAISIKKKPLEETDTDNEFVEGEVGRSERFELEDTDPSLGVAEEYGGQKMGMTEGWQMDGREEEEDDGEVRIGGDEMMEGEEEAGEVPEEDVGEERRRDEEVDRFEEERHGVVTERRKKKEFEVFVGGLDRDATEEDLREVFSQVGEITEIRLMRNPLTQQNKGFGFIRFATVSQARRAVNEFKRPVVNGKQCGVAPSQDIDTLFVGNICKTWSKKDLKERLAHYGIDNYEALTLVEDAKTEGMNRGFAFLEFSSRADALEVCKWLQTNHVVFGTDRTARVAFADTFIEPDDEIMSQVQTVFLDGLPDTWDEDRLKEHLQKFGKIEKVELARNMPAAKRKDFGFITFDNHGTAVACVDDINNAGLGDGDDRIKVKARLARPRQRGKSARHARGGYLLGHSGDRGNRGQWDSNNSRMDTWRSTDRDRDRRSIQSRSRTMYDGGYRQSIGHRDRKPSVDMVHDKIPSRRQVASPEISFSRKFPVSVYEKSSSKRDYAWQDDESFSRPPDFARAPRERHSYRDEYHFHESGILESPPRSVSHAATRRPSLIYVDDDDVDDDTYRRYMEQLPSYRGSRSRDYGPLSSSKRPHTAIEEVNPHYVESSITQSRARLDYDGSRSGLAYSDDSYESDPRRLGHVSRLGYDGGSSSSARRSHGPYGPSRSSVRYRRDEISREDVEDLYVTYDRDYMSREYVSTRAELDEGSYPSGYSRRNFNDGSSSKGSRSYY